MADQAPFDRKGKLKMKRILAVVLGVACSVGSARGNEIGFIEDFALARDRAEALKQLIPGTDEYYYFHCLHYQNLEKFDEVERLLKAWIKRHNYTGRVRQIQHRQALLTYNENPNQTLEYLRKQLGLKFNHQRESLGKRPDLPTTLDSHLISRETLQAEALRRYKNLKGFEDSAMDWLVASQLDPDRRRALLARLQRPDYPNLVSLVLADLNYKHSRGFGSFAIHRHLLLSQLRVCARRKPELLTQANFVHTYMAKLRPSADVDWRHDPDEHRAYLDRLWQFARDLPPVHNSLKAHVLYQRLHFDRSLGRYDKDRFMQYIQLPRNVRYVNPDYLRRAEHRRFIANLEQDFGQVTLFPPIGDDEPLVRSYLHHLFLTETSYKPYSKFIDDTYLRHQFAETKIVNGLGDPEEWYSMLPPARYQQLKERVDLDFAYTNTRVFDANESVGLDLLVKNVKTLLVKVYEVNTKNYYRENLQPVNTDINLDGLVANREDTHKYTTPSLRRVSRHFNFPGLEKPGVYVIDFIGNGKSSRVVIRKGQTRFISRVTPAGHAFQVFDESNELVKDATLWLGGTEYDANEDGLILVPFSNQPGRRPLILTRNGFSTLHHFEHRGEQYELKVGFYVDRESLLRGRMAQVVVRPGLYLNGSPVSLQSLEDVQFAITSTDHDGVSTTKHVASFQLQEDRDSTYEFRVPERVSQLAFAVTAQVEQLTTGKKVTVSSRHQFSLNQIDKSDKIADLHLSKIEDEYYVELLGKNAEAKTDRPVQLQLKHRDFRHPVNATLRTDESGRVALGPLKDIVSVTASSPDDTPHTWFPRQDERTWHQSIHASVGETIELPYLGKETDATREEFSLIELRGGGFVADRHDALSVEQGMLMIQGLPVGDFDLWLKRTGRHLQLRVTDGPRREGYLIGQTRQLESRGHRPLHITHLTATDDDLRVKVRNASPFTRVHVFAGRFEPAYSVFDQFGHVRDIDPLVRQVNRTESLYAEGRRIGDEYQYILDRREAPKFPGNLLDRPSLLLNPWAVRSTETSTQTAQDGEAFDRSEDSPDAAAMRPATGQAHSDVTNYFANLDFLKEGSVVSLNLKPDDNGFITIPREQLESHQHVHVVAIDPTSTTYRSMSLEESTSGTDDLRLLVGLNPEKHYTQQRQRSVVLPGDELVLPDITSSKYEAFDTISSVYRLFTTLTGNSQLAEFRFILQWPSMTDEQKREKYSKYACHELNYFLYRKDPHFFRRIVFPYLANKQHKTYLDQWLLSSEIGYQLRPWRYGQLNIVERILLSERLSEEREHTRRHVSDLFDLIPPNVEHSNFLFDTALKSNALEMGDKYLAFSKAKAEAKLGRTAAEKDALSRLSGLGLRREQLAEIENLAASAQPMEGQVQLQQSFARQAEEALEENASRLNSLADDSVAERRRGRASRARRPSGAGENARYFFGGFGADRKRMRQLYRKLDKTQEWAENNYYHLAIQQQNGALVTTNAFWNDYARNNPDEPFRSVHFAEATRNFTEMMFALAVLDLPFEAKNHKQEFEQSRMTLTAASPVIVFHEEVREAQSKAEETPILVSQNFFQQDDRYRHEHNERWDKFVTEEFLVQTVYGCQVVVTNPTSSKQKLNVLTQLPRGAVPVMNGRFTRTVNLDLDPYHTKTIEYFFYFPAAGDYIHFPVHVAKNEQLIASAEPFLFRVVDEPSKVDTSSWDYVSQLGTDEQVLTYLDEHNLNRTNLERIAFRMQEKPFFEKTVELLSRRHHYQHTLWSYGIKHNVIPAITEYLLHADKFLNQCGSYLDSPLVRIDPIERRNYEHLEYRPLVNARAHPLGKRRQILNSRFHGQYHRLLNILSGRRTLDDDELMSVTYYLLLQDRVEEAILHFAQVNPTNLASQLQYDYLTAYLTFYSDDQQLARDMADKYADYPVERWRKAFSNIGTQLDEIAGSSFVAVDAEDRLQSQTKLASTHPNFEFTVEAKQVRVAFQNIERVRVNYYLMDIELLFSRNPFVQQYSGRFSYIRPNGSQLIELPQGEQNLVFDLPTEFHSSNVLVEISAAGQSKTQAYFANSLTVQTIENYGQLQVTHDQTRTKLPSVYVKVYAQMHDGSVRFYKDGYTDLRGRFDYTSLNTNELEQVGKFSILVLSDEHGAVVREAKPPQS